MKFLIANFQFSKKARGFTLFFAMLTASLALSIGLAIYDLTVREIELSGAGTASQYAIYAADLGAECALYWDYKYTNAGSNNNGGTGSAFSTSTSDSLAAGSGANLWCNSQDVSTQGPPAADAGRYKDGTGNNCATSPWCVTTTGNAATTTFSISISSGGAATYCAVVQVAKVTGVGGITYSSITSRGYNTCSAGATRYERALQLSY